MEQEKCDADGFLALDDRTLQARFGLKREAVAFVRSPDSKTLETWQTLQQKGVTVLVRGQAGYPGRLNEVLGETAPPILYVLGRTELFQTPSVSFCGSRKASEKGLKVAEDSSRLLAGEQFNVISGYAHGVDLAAHKGALEAGGTTTIVLAEGILHFRTKEQLQDVLGDDPLARALVVSEFPPRLPWKAHNAMTRNRTICGLSNAMVVIESGLEGGTFEAGKTSLDLKLPLFCVEYAETVPSAAGNPYFLQHGAISLKRARNGQPNLSKLITILRDPTGTRPPTAPAEPQLTLHETPAPNVTQATQSEQIKMTSHPKRLIEVDLPIKRISVHARNEKDSRLGHIPRLHIYPAARPLAACRAVICAGLWPDPADKHCPEIFCVAASKEMQKWVLHQRQEMLSEESRPRFEKARRHPEMFKDKQELRGALLDFIADFANWDNSTKPEFLETSRKLTRAAHEALGGESGTSPLLVDPFSGGGAIPLEALRVGADAFASDLNPVSLTICKVVLEHTPKHGLRLTEEVEKGIHWIQGQATKELTQFYQPDEDGSTPIAYLWARTIISESPESGNKNPIEVPLLRTLWLAKKAGGKRAMRWVRDKQGAVKTEVAEVRYEDGSCMTVRRPLLEIFTPIQDSEVEPGTVRKTSATCPVTGYTTPAERVRAQLKKRNGGTKDARLYCIVTTRDGETGRQYRVTNYRDLKQIEAATKELASRIDSHKGKFPFLPTEPTPTGGGRGAGRAFGQRAYGMDSFSNLFNARQLLALTTYARLARDYTHNINDPELATAVASCFGLLVDRLADLNCSLCAWQLSTPNTAHVFVRWAIQIIMDFGEVNPLAAAGGSPESALRRMLASLENLTASHLHSAQVVCASADAHPLPDDSAQAFITDPPYYDAVPYADLSKFFLVWLKRSIPSFDATLDESRECIVDDQKAKDHAYFERTMTKCLAEGRRVLQPSGIGVIVFAHKSTAGWESLLQAIVDAGWIITASWPIDTEMESRLRAKKSAALASSVHLVCRPRENIGGSVRTDEIGDWRDVLQALPIRIHEWMPRLAEEGVVGADAIFACLGPALEIFSRYSRVEKADGETVTLKEYLEQIWAAVAKEALALVFKDADTSGFEADARLTAMWLWTLNAGNTDASNGDSAEEDDSEDESEGGSKKAKAIGFVLEYDAARKIAQGLGANLENLGSLVEVSGETARLLPVGERARHLFGKEEGKVTPARKKKVPQLDLFKVLEQADEGGTTFGETKVERHGETVLDRIHQSMILFAAGRSEAMKRFLVEDGAGRDPRFWRLAQALSALYPSSTEEKRWVDGVLARKKGLGF
jgi:DNA protecting protein DprA